MLLTLLLLSQSKCQLWKENWQRRKGLSCSIHQLLTHANCTSFAELLPVLVWGNYAKNTSAYILVIWEQSMLTQDTQAQIITDEQRLLLSWSSAAFLIWTGISRWYRAAEIVNTRTGKSETRDVICKLLCKIISNAIIKQAAWLSGEIIIALLTTDTSDSRSWQEAQLPPLCTTSWTLSLSFPICSSFS